jgi:epoxyqueuosine reductase
VKNLGPEKQILRDAQNDTREEDDDAPRGLVARFARGADYHDVLRDKLSRLSEAIRSEHPGPQLEICVDTTPIPERKLAVLAGMAWRGWNSNVFVEGCGSWVSLGEIVTDLELPPAKPLDIDRCRDCGRCMRHCPTGAIAAPYVADRRRCLSQLTQSRGAIPQELRPKLGNRIYGCDTCQEVCPQNSGIEPVTPEFSEPRFPGAHPELIPLIELTPAGFAERVRDSSIGWIGRNRIRRNAAVAAGNLRRTEAIPALTEMLADADPVLREHAAWAIDRIEQGGDDGG